MWHIHAKMDHLGNEVLQLELFQKPLDTAKISEICFVYQPTFYLLKHYKMKSSSVFDPKNDKMEAIYYFPQSFLIESIPINTPRDGNCLFHAVSLGLNGTLSVTRHL